MSSDDKKLDPAAVQAIIDGYLKSPNSRQRLAYAMSTPIRQRMDYQSIGRRAFSVEQMEPIKCGDCHAVLGSNSSCPHCIASGVMDT